VGPPVRKPQEPPSDDETRQDQDGTTDRERPATPPARSRGRCDHRSRLPLHLSLGEAPTTRHPSKNGNHFRDAPQSAGEAAPSRCLTHALIVGDGLVEVGATPSDPLPVVVRVPKEGHAVTYVWEVRAPGRNRPARAGGRAAV